LLPCLDQTASRSHDQPYKFWSTDGGRSPGQPIDGAATDRGCWSRMTAHECSYDTLYHSTVCGEKTTPINKYHYFQYISIFFYEIFRDCSGRSLPFLLRILSSLLLLLRCSISLNIKGEFFNCTDHRPPQTKTRSARQSPT